jgi:ATP-dependent DNA ligase
MQKKTFPDFVSPMMAQSAMEPFDSPDWIFEIKPDGYRAIMVFDADGKPRLWSLNGLPLEQKFLAISKAVFRLKLRFTVLDGEIVAVDENGIPVSALAKISKTTRSSDAVFRLRRALDRRGRRHQENTHGTSSGAGNHQTGSRHSAWKLCGG